MSTQLKKLNETVALSKLTPYDKNNKVHTEIGVSQLVENYNAVGIIDPIIVDEDYVILAGHKRWLAATQANQDNVDILKVSGLTDDQKRIYRIANNKLTHNSDWDFNNIEFELDQLKDFDIEALGIKFDLSGLEAELPDISEDRETDYQRTFNLTEEQAEYLDSAIDNESSNIKGEGNKNSAALMAILKKAGYAA